MILRLIALVCFLAGLGIAVFDSTPDQITLTALLFGGLAAWVADPLLDGRP